MRTPNLDNFDPTPPRNQLKILYKQRGIIARENGKKYLIVSDLHLGFEDKFRREGISLQSSITRITDELGELIEREKVSDLLINGDVKSSTDQISKFEWENVPLFFEKMEAICRVSVVPGNHDGGLEHLVPASVNLLDSSGVTIADTLIFHGHTRPPIKFQNSKRLVMGHVHPIYQEKGSPLSGQPLWVLLRVAKKDVFKEHLPIEDSMKGEKELDVILMPSFNLDLVIAGFALDTARQERQIAPLLRDLQNVSQAMVVTLDGDFIGDASLLPRVL